MRMISYDKAIEMVAERTSENRSELRKSRFQRRTEFTDLYGVPFYAESDDNNKAEFYISISPDLVYFLRFQFKLDIQNTTSDEFSIKIAGVDITDYLVSQHEGDWIDGSDIYPTGDTEESTDYYDVLAVATDLYNEDNNDDANKLLKPGFKRVVIESDAPFSCVLYLYCKYSVTGR